ncbi:hypothetical protein CPLU01_10486 [Colletotrichum plurivorum]|uniref:Uncharacterized protein n=1 Tax=Colletotrichum plurivorum TaxID=2175906 RepID=A0A8H6K5J5_9PEZI|nr:hypothetical protein CPLU01_10486 [Colletotrichum plurivorum]
MASEIDGASAPTNFSDLPTELRLEIWKLVPFPQRIIGQLPFPVQFRYIDMNTTDGCRIAGIQREHYLRFDVPFISYETDTIAIYGLWSAADVRLTATAWKPMLVGGHFLRAPFEDLGEAPFNPLTGFDLKRIQRLAVGTDIVHLAEHPNGPLIDPAAMPSLEIVYTLFYGLSTHPDALRRVMRMFPPELQNCGDCYVDFGPCTEYFAALDASPLRHQSQRRAISYTSELSQFLLSEF